MVRRIVVSTVAPIVLVGLLILTSGIPGHAVDNDLVCKDVSQRQRAGPPAGGPQGLCPDIVEQISHLQIQNEHQREKLRFSTTHINIGDGPLQIRGGGQIAPCNIDGIHYDQCTYSTQEVLDAKGNIVYSQPAGVAGASVDSSGNPLSGLSIGTYDVAANDPQRLGLDPTIQIEVKNEPLPNNFAAGDGLNTAGFIFSAQASERQHDQTIKIDQVINNRNTFYGRLAWGRDDSLCDVVNGGQPIFLLASVIILTIAFWFRRRLMVRMRKPA